MSSPTPMATSLAATARIKNANICPFKSPRYFPTATNPTLTALSRISVEKNYINKFLLLSIPKTPIINIRLDTIK